MIEGPCALPAAPPENGHLGALIDVQRLVEVVHLGRVHDVVLDIVLMVDAFEVRVVDAHVVIENCAGDVNRIIYSGSTLVIS